MILMLLFFIFAFPSFLPSHSLPSVPAAHVMCFVYFSSKYKCTTITQMQQATKYETNKQQKHLFGNLRFFINQSFCCNAVVFPHPPTSCISLKQSASPTGCASSIERNTFVTKKAFSIVDLNNTKPAQQSPLPQESKGHPTLYVGKLRHLFHFFFFTTKSALCSRKT
jgi:hypothetical protein